MENASGTKINKNEVVYFFKNIITKNLHSFNKMYIGDKVKLQGKKDDKILNKETVVLIAQACFLKMKRLLTPVILN